MVCISTLQWNDVGIDVRHLQNAVAMDSSAMGLIRQLYFSPRVNLLWDLDATARRDTDWLSEHRRTQASRYTPTVHAKQAAPSTV
jgi:hypothetical protein